MPVPIVVATPTTALDGVGPTREELRRYTGRAIGRLRVLLTGTPVSLTASPDANREVIINALAADGMPTDRLDGNWLYFPSGAYAGQTRGVWGGSLHGARGAILLDQPLSDIVPEGTTVELSHPVPGDEWFDQRGLNQFVQEGLERILVPIRIPLVATGSNSLALGIDYDWLYDEAQLIGIEDGDQSYSDYPDLPSAYPVTIRRSAAGANLILWRRYSAGEAFTLVAAVPADRYVFDGTSWAYRPRGFGGLQADHWQTAAPREWVIPFAASKALEYLIGETEADERLSDALRKRRLDAYNRKYEKFVTVAADIKATRFPRAETAPERPYFEATPPAIWSR